jgi:hypothetical protein
LQYLQNIESIASESSSLLCSSTKDGQDQDAMVSRFERNESATVSSDKQLYQCRYRTSSPVPKSDVHRFWRQRPPISWDHVNWATFLVQHQPPPQSLQRQCTKFTPVFLGFFFFFFFFFCIKNVLYSHHNTKVLFLTTFLSFAYHCLISYKGQQLCLLLHCTWKYCP